MTGHLEVHEPFVAAGEARIAARLSLPGLEEETIWFSVPEDHAERLVRWADPFVIGALRTAAGCGQGLRVTGAPVSPSLLENLAELQLAWSRLRGTDVVEVVAEAPAEREDAGSGTLVPFSGGVDSAYTLRQHTSGTAPAPAPGPHVALIVQGFDVPLDDEQGFAGATARARRMTDSLGVELITARTNLRRLNSPWPRFHGTAVAATLTALSSGSSAGLVASGSTYDRLDLSSGANPVTDHLHSSRSFRIRHDGAGTTRAEKLEALSDWPEAMRWLRVCWAGPDKDRNCGACRKCVTVALTCRVLGIEPQFFERPVAERDVMRAARTVPTTQASATYRELILDEARRRGFRARWLRAMARVQRRYRARQTWDQLRAGVPRRSPLRRQIRRMRRRARRRLGRTS